MSLEFEIPLVSLIFIIILNIIYFSRKRIDLIENKPYEVILISSFLVSAIDTIIHIICSINTFNDIVIKYYNLFNYLNKILSILFVVIFSSLFCYTMMITYEKIKKNCKKIIIVLSCINIIFSVVMLFTNIELIDAKFATNVTGLTIILGYMMVALMLGLSLLISLINIKKIDKRYLPIFIIFLILVFLYFFSLLFPGMIIYDFILALMCYIMYFTIENPDMKLLDEVHKAKVISDNANEEKTMFLYNITNEIRGITKDINTEADNILNETDNKKVDLNIVNDSAREIKGSAAKFTTMTNEILDISQVDASKIKIYNEKYSIKLILKELITKYSVICKNKSLDFRTNINSDIPEVLYGDSVGIKNVLITLLDNSIKYTKKGYVELNVNVIKKQDIARLIITIEDSGIGIKSNELNNIINKNKEEIKRNDLKNNLYTAKKLITLMGGTLILSSTYGQGTIMKVVLDQKQEVLNNKYDKVYNEKKILLIEDSETTYKLITKMLKNTKVIIDRVELGSIGLDKIRSHEKYDLIFVEEDLKPLNAYDIIKKLKQIKNFNTKVILLTKNKNIEYSYLYKDYGFSDYLIKPIDKSLLLNIINGAE